MKSWTDLIAPLSLVDLESSRTLLTQQRRWRYKVVTEGLDSTYDLCERGSSIAWIVEEAGETVANNQICLRLSDDISG